MIERIERYCDEVPRAGADVVEHGPFTIFVSRGPWAFYARPRVGEQAFTAADVSALARRQRELDQPVAIEWIEGVTPSLEIAAREAGLRVRMHPLLVLDGEGVGVEPVPGALVGRVEAGDERLPAVLEAVGAAFGQAGATPAAAVAHRRETIRAGTAVLVGAFDEPGAALGGGSAIPRGDVAELVGIGTLAVARRRGIGRLVTATLAEAARTHGAATVFLTAGSDEVARVYERCGFRRLGTAGIAAA